MNKPYVRVYQNSGAPSGYIFTNKALTFTSRGFAMSQSFCIFVTYNKLNVCKYTL